MLLYSGTHDKGKVGDLLGLFPLELKILLCWLPSWKRCPNGYTSPVVVANGNIDRDSPPYLLDGYLREPSQGPVLGLGGLGHFGFGIPHTQKLKYSANRQIYTSCNRIEVMKHV